MVSWLNNYSPSAKNYSTFEYLPSEQAFLNIITDSDYATVSATSPLYSLAVVINSAYPSWDYTLRMNQTYGFRKYYY